MGNAATVTPTSTLWDGIFNCFSSVPRNSHQQKENAFKTSRQMFPRCGTFGQIIGKIFHNFMNTFMQGLNFDIPIRHQTRRYYLNFTAILLTSRSINYNIKFDPAIMSQLGFKRWPTFAVLSLAQTALSEIVILVTWKIEIDLINSMYVLHCPVCSLSSWIISTNFLQKRTNYPSYQLII